MDVQNGQVYNPNTVNNALIKNKVNITVNKEKEKHVITVNTMSFC